MANPKRTGRTTHWLLACATVARVLAVPSNVSAQGLPGEVVLPGTSYATATDVDAARLNPGGVSFIRSLSGRLTHITDFAPGGSSTLDATSITLASPFAFGLAGALGFTWQRPLLGGTRGHVLVIEPTLAMRVPGNLGIGARLRITAAPSSLDSTRPLDGAALLDLGITWRPLPQFAVAGGVAGTLGPQAPGVDYVRTFQFGLGFRPAGSDVLTLGLDGAVTQQASVLLRAAVAGRIPRFGQLRAEGVLDPRDPSHWRASLGFEMGFGHVTAGAAGFLGPNSPPSGFGAGGFVLSARIEQERERGVWDARYAVTVVTPDELGPRGLTSLLLRLEMLRRDPSVRAVLFAPRSDLGGLASGQALREALVRLRASGRRVVCHLLDASGAMYDACTGADAIAMDPVGLLRLAGVRSARFFLGDALRELGVRTEFVRIGAWKSAPEQFTRGGSSDEARRQESQLLDDVFDALAHDVADGRHVPDAQARAMIVGGPWSPTRAREAGLVDTIGTRDEVARLLARGVDAIALASSDYARLRPVRWSRGTGIAVVHLDGDIVDGESVDVPLLGIHMLGDRDAVRLLDEVAADGRTAAVVLAIDSPGGSATASEIIWRAVRRLAERKPVIALLGRVAASGGYYVASAAREIVAEPTTLTGSIGIFFGKADLSPLLVRLHVGVELDRRGDRADMDSMFRGWTDDERNVVSALLEDGYRTFVDRVAAGRGRTFEQIHAVGEGRVFAGSRARENGLVDRNGGLLEALDRARAAAALPDDCEIVELPAERDGLLLRLARAVLTESGASPMTALRLDGPALQAFRWLVTVSRAGAGHAMALTDWPIEAP